MGLLSDPKQRIKIINALTKYNLILCIFCYVVGVTWFLALAYQPLNASTYFSENALLPGLVDNEFHANLDVISYNEKLLAEMKKSDKSLPREWIFKEFQKIGLDTYYHNFSLNYPFGMPKDKSIPGQNIYAIYRAKRAASTEALVMSVPLRLASVVPDEQTSGGIAVMLAIAKHFRKQTYWAKDIIFLMTEYDEIGMQAWLNGYHQTESEYIHSENLPAISGPIQAAINLEIPGDQISSYNLKLEGLNGQLPNLDLSNLVVRICGKEQAMVTLNKRADTLYPDDFDGFKHSLITMLYMMWNQASGTPTGNHGLFHKYHIESLTIQGVKGENAKHTFGVEKTARLVEGVFRSLNNLLERFHQSFFFYILPSTRRYVSIGLYMPPFGFMIAASLIKAITLWVGTIKTPEQTTDKSEEKEEKTKSEDEDDDEDDDGEDKPVSGIISVLPVIFISMLMALLAYNGPGMLTRVSQPFRLRPEDSLIFGLLALFTASLAFPKMFNKKNPDQVSLQLDWKLLKCIGLIVQSLTLFSIALMNISLAFFFGAALVPVTTFIVPTKSRLLQLFQLLCLLLVSPAAFVLISSYVLASLENYSNSTELMYMIWGNMKQCVFMKLLDLYLFGNWTYTVVSFVIYPCWLFFWAIPLCTTSIDSNRT